MSNDVILVLYFYSANYLKTEWIKPQTCSDLRSSLEVAYKLFRELASFQDLPGAAELPPNSFRGLLARLAPYYSLWRFTHPVDLSTGLLTTQQPASPQSE